MSLIKLAWNNVTGQAGIDAAINHPALLEDWVWEAHAPKNKKDHTIARTNLRNSIKDELMSSLNNEEKNTITDKEAYNKADKIFEKRLYSGKDPHMNRYNKMYNKYIPD